MTDTPITLREAWTLRNAAADTLVLSERQMERLVASADLPQLVALVESFAPSRSTDPDWTRSFEALVERLWTWSEPETLAALQAEFEARGPAWANVAADFSSERGAQLRDRIRQPAWARLPAFTVA